MTIVSNAFLELATAQARMRGVDELPVVVVTHPVGGLLPDELLTRALEASDALRRSFAGGSV